MGIAARIAASLFILTALALTDAAGTRAGAAPSPLRLAQAAAGQPAAPSAKEFWIYFASDQFFIRPDAQKTLDDVVAAIKKLGAPKVILTGHADTAGVATDDARLTQRRAEQAKKYLVAHGVPEGDITTIAKGKTDLRVLTPRNVHSQENRNVHIELQ